MHNMLTKKIHMYTTVDGLETVCFLLQKMHAAGKTEEARADLARLAIIRKQREDAAKKREEEKLGKKLCIGQVLQWGS